MCYITPLPAKNFARQCQLEFRAPAQPAQPTPMPRAAAMAAVALLSMQALCAGGQPEHPSVSATCECDRGEDRAWPQRCDKPFAERCPCPAGGWSMNVGPTFVVLLNSFEKLTWATVGLGRLLMMANSSGTVSLVEPCVADSEIGGFGHRDWLQLDTYFDTERLRSTLRPGTLVTVGQYVGAMRSSRRAAAEPATQGALVVDAARSLDVLVVFVWWEKERQDLAFRPPLGLIDCRARLLAKGHLRQAPQGVGWFEVDKMREGTDNRTIDAPGMRFRRVLCADPYYLDACPAHVAPIDAEQTPVLEGLEGLVHVSRAQWLSLLDRHLRALDGMQRVTDHQDSGREPSGQGFRGSPDEKVAGGRGADEAVLAVALASYRRTALADIGQGEERWGRWPEDAWMAKQVRARGQVSGDLSSRMHALAQSCEHACARCRSQARMHTAGGPAARGSHKRGPCATEIPARPLSVCALSGGPNLEPGHH